jgi:hypothetical protein
VASTDLLRWLVLAAALPAVAFPIVYYFIAPWRDTYLGRHTMAFSLMIALTLLNSSVAQFWPGYPGRAWVGLALFGWLIFMLWRRLYLLVAVQWHPERYDHPTGWRRLLRRT